MSREVIIKIRDDLDGSDADETVRFTVRGIEYEIDLSTSNAELFDKSLQQFVDAARLTKPAPIAGQPVTKVPVEKRAAFLRRREIRGWASRNGWPELADSNQGRLPFQAIEAYQATHPEVELPPELVPRRVAPKPSSGHLESITAQEIEQQMAALGAIQEAPHQRASAATREARRRELFGDKLDSLDMDRRKQIRAWANDNGFSVPPTGIIGTAVLSAYFAAHPEDN